MKKKILAVSAAFLPVAAVTLFGADPANGAARNISDGHENNWCYGESASNQNLGCLFWGRYYQGAYWGIKSDRYPDLAGYKFSAFRPPGTSSGMGTPVKNNAASIESHSSKTIYIFYNENFSGNYDYVSGFQHGNLSYTANNNASLRVGNRCVGSPCPSADNDLLSG